MEFFVDNFTSLPTVTPLTKKSLGREIWHSIVGTYNLLTVKLTSVIMVSDRQETYQLLNNVVVGIGNTMRDVYDINLNDLSKKLQEKNAQPYYQWYLLRKKGYTMKNCYWAFEQIGFYIEPDEVEKAERLMKAEAAAMKDLNRVFRNIF